MSTLSQFTAARLLGAALLVAPCAAARAQVCETVSSRTSLASLSGRPIAAVHVVTADPDPLPGPAAHLGVLHVRTRASTVRRELLVAAGDTVDTLRVAESLRRLRALRLLADVEMRASDCGGPVELTVTTQDLWSTKPNVQVRSSSAALELRERNLFGLGREAALSLRSDRGRVGVGALLRDPAAFGGRTLLSLSASRYGDGGEWSATLARRERSVIDPWRYELFVTQASYTPVVSVAQADASTTVPVIGERFRRARAGALMEHRVRLSERATTSLQGGVEYEHAGLVAAPDLPRLGPGAVRRELTALDLGVRQRSVAYDTLTWLLPANALVDVPLALEYDALLGVGRETASGTPIAHVDLWGGRIWRPDPRSLLVTDLWASGYRTPGDWSAGVLRGSAAYYRAAPRGLWLTRLGVERLFDPDPDLRAMVTADPTAAALPARAGLAQAVVGFSMEREVRLRALTRSWTLDGAAFLAASTRWDPAVTPGVGVAASSRDAPGEVERLDVGMVGLGLRLEPTRLGRATARLDVGYPVIHSAGLRTGPVVAISITPWLEQGRHRDGHGEP